jgi:hypothetical protein
MTTNSFEKQFPGYDLIQEKKSKFTWPLIWLTTIIGVLGIPALLLYNLSNFRPPVPALVGFNELSLLTVGNLAVNQTEAGNHRDAVIHFKSYFDLGGNDADKMALYAFSLSKLGNKDEALLWSRKAIETNPSSKAARLIHDVLETKKP